MLGAEKISADGGENVKKTILIVLVLGLLAAAGAFAELALGLNGALYIDDPSGYTVGDVGAAFQKGEGIYYGPLAELLGKRMGLGLSFMFSRYTSSFDILMQDTDLNLYLDGHILGSRFLIDPMVEAGLGWIQKDYANETEDDDPDNPITATKYWFLGGGLGLNIWRLGVFAKFIYHFPMGPVQMTDPSGTLTGINLEAFGLKPYKIVLGAKFIF